MRHGKKFNHLGRKSAHRKAMLRNMANSLIEHKRIVTTTPKAKALRKFIEPLVTKAVRDFKKQGGEVKKNPHARRVVFSYLNNKEAVTELFDNIAQTVGDRPGGYTRILKIGNRPGDNADMSFIEFVDFSEFDTGKTGSGSGKSRRRRRRRGKKGGATEQQAAVETQVEEVITDAEVVAEEAVEEVVDQVEGTVEEVVEETAAVVAEEVEEAVEETTIEDSPAEDGDDSEASGDAEEDKSKE